MPITSIPLALLAKAASEYFTGDSPENTGDANLGAAVAKNADQAADAVKVGPNEQQALANIEQNNKPAVPADQGTPPTDSNDKKPMEFTLRSAFPISDGNMGASFEVNLPPEIASIGLIGGEEAPVDVDDSSYDFYGPELPPDIAAILDSGCNGAPIEVNDTAEPIATTEPELTAEPKPTSKPEPKTAAAPNTKATSETTTDVAPEPKVATSEAPAVAVADDGVADAAAIDPGTPDIELHDEAAIETDTTAGLESDKDVKDEPKLTRKERRAARKAEKTDTSDVSTEEGTVAESGKEPKTSDVKSTDKSKLESSTDKKVASDKKEKAIDEKPKSDKQKAKEERVATRKSERAERKNIRNMSDSERLVFEAEEKYGKPPEGQILTQHPDGSLGFVLIENLQGEREEDWFDQTAREMGAAPTQPKYVHETHLHNAAVLTAWQDRYVNNPQNYHKDSTPNVIDDFSDSPSITYTEGYGYQATGVALTSDQTVEVARLKETTNMSDAEIFSKVLGTAADAAGIAVAMLDEE